MTAPPSSPGETGEHTGSPLEHLRLRRILITAWRDNVLFLASAVSFDALLTAIPLTLLFLAVFGFVLNVRPDDVGAVGNVLQLILPDVTPGATDPVTQAERLIRDVIESRQAFSLLGIPMFVLFSTRLFATVRIALDRILEVTTLRRWRHDFLHDLVLVIIVTVLFVAQVFVSIPYAGPIGDNLIIRHLTAMLFSSVLFFIMYSLSPTKKPRWDTALVAAVAAAATFEISKVLYGIYLTNAVTLDRLISNRNAIAVLLFALWIYVTAVIFLLGAEVAKVEQARKERRSLATSAPDKSDVMPSTE